MNVIHHQIDGGYRSHAYAAEPSPLTVEYAGPMYIGLKKQREEIKTYAAIQLSEKYTPRRRNGRHDA